jgi:hypothetical protein
VPTALIGSFRHPDYILPLFADEVSYVRAQSADDPGADRGRIRSSCPVVLWERAVMVPAVETIQLYAAGWVRRPRRGRAR